MTKANTPAHAQTMQFEPLIKGRFNPTLMACGFFALFIVSAILTARCLYADGSYYFLRVLETGHFTEMIGCRDFAAYLFQLPVVVALALGIHGMPCLTILFGIGCFCAWPLAMFLCYHMAPRHFWLVMLACAAGYLNTAFMAVGEHIVAHAFFWPALFAILFVRPLTPFAAVSLLGSSIVLMRSYESMLFLGPVLIALLIWRMAYDREQPWRQAVLGAAVVFLVVAVYIAWIGVKYPNTANYNGFKHGFLREMEYPAWTVKMSLLWTGLMLIAMFPPAIALLRKPTGILFSALVILGWGLYPIFEPLRINPAVQYDCRFLDLLVPLALVPVAVILSVRPQWLAAKTPALVWLSAAMLMAQSLWHLSATYQWDRYVGNWKNMLAAKSGPIFLAGDNVFNKPDLSWVDPTESLIIGPSNVRAMIMPDQAHSWQPFDPLKPQSLPDLKSYGLNYTQYTACLNRGKSLHE
ncbi:MAG TPA: hypothetical protein VGJ73_02310 [Verrucomicrobiae bacterium]